MKHAVVVLCELWMLKLTFATKLKFERSNSSRVVPVAHLPTQGSPGLEGSSGLDIREHSHPDSDNDAHTMSSDPLDLQGLEKVADFRPCWRKGHFEPADDDVCARAVKKPTSIRMMKLQNAKIPEKELKECPPKPAVLLTGLMRDWERHIGELEKSTLEPCNTDVFVATNLLPSPLRQRLGTRLKGVIEANCTPDAMHEVWKTKDGPFTPPWCQWLHLSRAWDVMAAHENKHGFQYDVVFRQRSDMAIQPPAYMTFVGWQEADKVHMMTDMLFWAPRPAFEKVAALAPNLYKYFVVKHPDPYKRELNAARLLDSLKRDAFLNGQDKSEGWSLYQKMATIPYPDMGLPGAVPNLEAAVKKGMNVVVGQQLHCGDFCNPCDYGKGWFVTEKDTLQWVINQNLTICDIGASVHLVRAKRVVTTRKLARNC